MHIHTGKDAHSVTQSVLTTVEVHPLTPAPAHTERLLTFASSTHFFFCQAFLNEGHEIDPCNLRRIDPFPP